MITPLLFAFLGLQQAQFELQTQFNDLRSRVTDLQGQFGGLRDQLGAVNKNAEQIRAEVQKTATCDADVQWIPLSASRTVDPQLPIAISLFSAVSKPEESCLDAEVRILANYYDAKGGYICGGTVSIPQTINVQNHLFEFQPMTLEQFVKWRNGQTWDRSTYRTLRCYDYEGLENRDPAPVASSLKLFATVLPRRGGLAKAEITFTMPVPVPTAPPRLAVPRSF